MSRRRDHLLGAEISQTEALAFVDSWNGLPLDEDMADGGRYRRRRHAVYPAEAGGLTRQPNQPHYQSLAHNPLNGGIARWFAPIPTEIGEGPTLRSVISLRSRCRIGCAARPSAGAWRSTSSGSRPTRAKRDNRRRKGCTVTVWTSSS